MSVLMDGTDDTTVNAFPPLRQEFLYMDADDPRYHQDPEFTLDDFTIDPRDVKPAVYSRNGLKEAVLSKQNFNKMTTLFASFVDKPFQEKVHTQQLKGIYLIWAPFKFAKSER